jgi:uncharacterized protein (DUF302 family)
MSISLPTASATSSTSSIDRVTVRTGLPYAALMEAFEKEVGHWSAGISAQLVAESAVWEKTRDTIGAMAGQHGLMIFTKINQGEIASLAGKSRSCVPYLVGNPIIATDILNVDIRAGMLVPFRVELYDDGEGGVLSYDLPSSFLASLGKPELAEIGKSLDQKIGSVAQALSKTPCMASASSDRDAADVSGQY